MRISNQPCYVLHTRPYTESSLLVDLFTRNYGRFMVVAKGARRQKTGLRGVLMPFSPLILSWAGKGQLPILVNAETPGYLPALSEKARHSAYYMNELLLKLMHRFDPHMALYDQYHDGLHQLTRGADPAATLRMFEKSLLKETGFGLILDHDVETGEMLNASAQYRYIPDRGPVRIGYSETEVDDDPRSGNSPGISVSGQTLMALQHGAFDADSLRQARSLNRMLIQRQLGQTTLRSRRVMLQMIQYQGESIDTR